MGHSTDNDAVLALLNSLLIAGQADPTAYMDTYCNGSFAGSRAARDDELADQRIQGLPSSPQNMVYQGLYAFFACELRFRCLDPSADVYHLAWNKSVSFTSQTWQMQQATNNPGAIVCVKTSGPAVFIPPPEDVFFVGYAINAPAVVPELPTVTLAGMCYCCCCCY